MENEKPKLDDMPWYTWILMYGILIPLFVLGIFVEAEMPWWFVPACFGTFGLCLALLYLHFKIETRRKRREKAG